MVVLHKSAGRQIRHLRISPIGVTPSKDKLRIILDLSFGRGGANDGNSGVNGDTWFENAPNSEAGEVMPIIMKRICALRQAVEAASPIFSAKMDVKDAFRRIQLSGVRHPHLHIWSVISS